MEIINLERLRREESDLARTFKNARPFGYIVIDEFLHADHARAIYEEYPRIDKSWVDVNGPHQRKKWTKPSTAGSIAEAFYREVNSQEFRACLGRITGIRNLLPDDSLEGAGYHQIRDGGFLNVHVDFNKLGELDRRLNLIVYMNPGWRDEYGGFLELWDMTEKVRVANIAPAMNRCVVFETNEVSYHGHPVPLRTGDITRKSLSVYYYTAGRDDIVAVDRHSTIYVNTQGTEGLVRITVNKFFHVFRRLRNAHRKISARLRRP